MHGTSADFQEPAIPYPRIVTGGYVAIRLDRRRKWLWTLAVFLVLLIAARAALPGSSRTRSTAG